MGLKVGLKEWSAVTEALGSGEQTILVHAVEPKHQEFFLYPTFNFANDPQKFPDRFQSKYLAMAKKSGEETTKRGKEELLVDIKYFAHIEKTVQIDSPKIWKQLEPYFIWKSEHVNQYAQATKKGCASLWIVRVFKFPAPIVIGRWSMGGPPDYYRQEEEISTKGGSPILPDADFTKTKNEILQIVGLNAPMVNRK